MRREHSLPLLIYMCAQFMLHLEKKNSHCALWILLLGFFKYCFLILLLCGALIKVYCQISVSMVTIFRSSFGSSFSVASICYQQVRIEIFMLHCYQKCSLMQDIMVHCFLVVPFWIFNSFFFMLLFAVPLPDILRIQRSRFSSTLLSINRFFVLLSTFLFLS